MNKLYENQFKTSFDSISRDDRHCDTIIVTLDFDSMGLNSSNLAISAFDIDKVELYSLDQNRVVKLDELDLTEKVKLHRECEHFFDLCLEQKQYERYFKNDH